MTAAVGYPTLRLVRVGIADLSVGQLGPGQWRDLTPDEVQALTEDMAAQTAAAGTYKPASKTAEYWPGGVRPGTKKTGQNSTGGYNRGGFGGASSSKAGGASPRGRGGNSTFSAKAAGGKPKSSTPDKTGNKPGPKSAGRKPGPAGGSRNGRG